MNAQAWVDHWLDGKVPLADALANAMLTGEPMPMLLQRAYCAALDEYQRTHDADLAELLGVAVTDRQRQREAVWERRLMVRALVEAGIEDGHSLVSPRDYPEADSAFAYASRRLAGRRTAAQVADDYYALPAQARI